MVKKRGRKIWMITDGLVAKLTMWMCKKMKRCGQEQDFPLSSASITSPPKTELPPFYLKISKVDLMLSLVVTRP